MIYAIGIAILVVVVLWVVSLRNAGTASGKAIAEEFNAASDKMRTSLNELVREVPKTEPERLSPKQFHKLVERAADDFSRYAQAVYIVSSKLNQSSSKTTKPYQEFLATATAEFATAIGTAIQERNSAPLKEIMSKYGVKS